MTNFRNKSDQALDRYLGATTSTLRQKISSITPNWLKQFSLFSLLLILAACSGRADVVTQDDSADYHSARSLPPLIKPGDTRTTSSNRAETQNSGETPPSRTTTVTGVEPPTATAPTPTVEAPPSTAGKTDTIVARVNRLSDATARLVIEADYQQAWDFVTQNLKSSDLTVHTRNQTAGRLAIGCGEIQAVETTKKGGWSFFKRKPEELEHCALQLVSSKGDTNVQVLNRSGAEVDADSAEAIFNRLLNN